MRDHFYFRDIESIRRSVRLVVLLASAENAGLSPMPIVQLHTLAYFANVLAPVWQMPVMEGKILKRHGGPFYPALQQDLDSLVGCGLVTVSHVGYVQTEDGKWRLDAHYAMNDSFCSPILAFLSDQPDERGLMGFIQELTYALSSLTDGELQDAAAGDATYSDPVVDFGNVVDFAEWQSKNFTENVANEFENVMPGQVQATDGEKLHLYIKHLQRRMRGGQ